MNFTITSHVPKALEELKQKRAMALEVIGGTAERYAKETCPVRTGNLRNSIFHQQIEEDTEAIGSGVHYAPYVELGTIKMTARPYLRPAAENHASEYQAIVRRIFGE